MIKTQINKYMSANYDFIKRPTTKGQVADNRLYVRLKSKGTINFDRIVEDVVSRSGFSSGTVKGVAELLEQVSAEYIKDGYHVKMGRMGSAFARLKARPVSESSEIRSASVEVSNVNFIPSLWLKKAVHGFATRATRKFSESQQLSLEQRKALLTEYFESHSYITRIQYSALTGLLRTKALEELNRFVAEGFLDFDGKMSHKIFVKI